MKKTKLTYFLSFPPHFSFWRTCRRISKIGISSLAISNMFKSIYPSGSGKNSISKSTINSSGLSNRSSKCGIKNRSISIVTTNSDCRD